MDNTHNISLSIVNDEVVIEIPNAQDKETEEQHGYLACALEDDEDTQPPTYSRQEPDKVNEADFIQERLHRWTLPDLVEAVEDSNAQAKYRTLQGVRFCVQERMDEIDVYRQLATKRRLTQDWKVMEERYRRAKWRQTVLNKVLKQIVEVEEEYASQGTGIWGGAESFTLMGENYNLAQRIIGFSIGFFFMMVVWVLFTFKPVN